MLTLIFTYACTHACTGNVNNRHVNISLFNFIFLSEGTTGSELYSLPYVPEDKWYKDRQITQEMTATWVICLSTQEMTATFEVETDGQKAFLLPRLCEYMNVWQHTPECKHIDLPMGCLLHRVTLPMLFGSKLITHDKMINLVYVPLSVGCARPYAVLLAAGAFCQEPSPVCFSVGFTSVQLNWSL